MAKAVLKPLGDRIVAQTEKAQSKTASGLYIPDNAQQKSKVATVIAIGPMALNVKVGDKIIYKEFAATEIKMQGEEYLIINQEDVLATVG